MKRPPSTLVRCQQALLFILVSVSCVLRADDAPAASAPAPKPLIDLSSPDAASQVKPNFGAPVYTLDKTGISVQLPAGKGNYAGIQVYPPGGAATWDLTPYGHIEAKITNTGTTVIRFNIVAKGVAQGAPAQDAEIFGIKPGETKVVKLIFGYVYGYHPGPALEQASVSQVILYVGKMTVDQSFRVEDLQAAGTVGEKPPFNPDNVVTIPPNGVILGPGVTFDPAKQVVANGAKVSAGPDGTVAVNFSGSPIKIKPAMGIWNLTQANEIKVKFKNVGEPGRQNHRRPHGRLLEKASDDLMNPSSFSRPFLVAMLLLFLADDATSVRAQTPAAAPAGLALIDFTSPDAAKQVALAKGTPAGSTVSVNSTGIAVNFAAFQPGDADHPGLHITPASGTAWDLSAYGHVAVKVTNTSDRDIKFVMHVVPTGEAYSAGSNQEYLQIQPGETKVVKVIFGYSHGYKPARPINSASISEIFLFLYHSIKPHTFLIEQLQAAGIPGQKPV